jgi:hypothetical protein
LLILWSKEIGYVRPFYGRNGRVGFSLLVYTISKNAVGDICFLA